MSACDLLLMRCALHATGLVFWTQQRVALMTGGERVTSSLDL